MKVVAITMMVIIVILCMVIYNDYDGGSVWW